MGWREVASRYRTDLILFVTIWALAGSILGGLESFGIAFVGSILVGLSQGVLGGGIMEALEESMMPIIQQTALDYALNGTSNDIVIRASKLADDTGIVGGAVLARKLSK